MKGLLGKIEAAFAAVAFAEEGDADTARQILAEPAAEPAGPRSKQAESRSRLSPRAPLAKGSRA